MEVVGRPVQGDEVGVPEEAEVKVWRVATAGPGPLVQAGGHHGGFGHHVSPLQGLPPGHEGALLLAEEGGAHLRAPRFLEAHLGRTHAHSLQAPQGELDGPLSLVAQRPPAPGFLSHPASQGPELQGHLAAQVRLPRPGPPQGQGDEGKGVEGGRHHGHTPPLLGTGVAVGGGSGHGEAPGLGAQVLASQEGQGGLPPDLRPGGFHRPPDAEAPVHPHPASLPGEPKAALGEEGGLVPEKRSDGPVKGVVRQAQGARQPPLESGLKLGGHLEPEPCPVLLRLGQTLQRPLPRDEGVAQPRGEGVYGSVGAQKALFLDGVFFKEVKELKAYEGQAHLQPYHVAPQLGLEAVHVQRPLGEGSGKAQVDLGPQAVLPLPVCLLPGLKEEGPSQGNFKELRFLLAFLAALGEGA